MNLRGSGGGGLEKPPGERWPNETVPGGSGVTGRVAGGVCVDAAAASELTGGAGTGVEAGFCRSRARRRWMSISSSSSLSLLRVVGAVGVEGEREEGEEGEREEEGEHGAEGENLVGGGGGGGLLGDVEKSMLVLGVASGLCFDDCSSGGGGGSCLPSGLCMAGEMWADSSGWPRVNADRLENSYPGTWPDECWIDRLTD